MRFNKNIAIVSNEDSQSHLLWVQALKNKGIGTFDVIDITQNNWLDVFLEKSYDLIILRPPGKHELFKNLYDERVLLLSQYVKAPIYPSVNEIFIYENKRFLRDWLEINDIPHPKTFVFYKEQDAIGFLNTTALPIVAKTNIGASGNGVRILKTTEEARKYIKIAFSTGVRPITGPKLTKGSPIKKFKKVLKNKKFLKQRLKDYNSGNLNTQYHFVIFQEFIPHEFEWRCVRIGDSFFAHKKIVKGEKSSGTLLKGYNNVPYKLLDFIKNISDKHNIKSAAIDVFENQSAYLVNEIQCYFGQSDPYQMLVNDKPGRYIFTNNQWVFEEGMFNTTESYDLRLQDALKLIK